MGRPELARDPRFLTNALRSENQDACYQILDAWLLTHTKEELRLLADEHSFAAAPVLNSQEICELPHYLEREAIVEIDDPNYGKMKLATMPTRFSESPAPVKHVGGPLGSANEQIYGKYLGYTQKDLARLREAKVI